MFPKNKKTMEAKANNPCSLEQELVQKTSELERQRYERERDIVDITLNGIADKVVSKEQDILQVMSERGARQQAVREIAIREVVLAADGLLWCPEYVEKLNSEQHVRVYTGNHWKDIESQQWKDFVAFLIRCAWITSL